jgi:RNA polymerase sigma-70 factor (sigma-E family)
MASLEELVAAHGQSLFRLAFMLTGTRHAAEDLYQETWVTAHRKWPKISRADRPGAYLRRVMVNGYISQSRKRSSTEMPLEDLSSSTSLRVVGPEAAHVERDEMWGLLASLPRAEQAALVLRFYEDLSDQEAAEVLGCRPSTVRANTSRALARLRDRRVQEGTVST